MMLTTKSTTGRGSGGQTDEEAGGMSPTASWMDLETLSTLSNMNAHLLDELPEEPEKPSCLTLCKARMHRTGDFATTRFTGTNFVPHRLFCVEVHEGCKA